MSRAPRPITAAYLQAVTARYLEQRSTSAAHLRRLLMARVRRSVAHHGHDLRDGTALVDAEIARLVGLGWVDDPRYALDKARGLHRRGCGRRRIEAALRAKGLGPQVVADAVAARAEGTEDPEWEAALIFARKRRIGEWREGDLDEDRRRRELGKLARAGFSYAVAARVVDAERAP